jgi:hypothetical protein
MSFAACQFLVGESCGKVLAVGILVLAVAEIPLIEAVQAIAATCEVQFPFPSRAEPMGEVGVEELHEGIMRGRELHAL